MILIIGGAYQGKLEYAKNEYLLTDGDVFFCENVTYIDTSKHIVYELEKLIFNRMKSGLESEKYIASLKSELDGAIIIVNDISCGVVPIDADVREWRECVGRVCAMLARSAERVIRIFCGLPQVIK